MVSTQSHPCHEARIEEQEFYHLVLNASLNEEGLLEGTLEEFLDHSLEGQMGERYPSKWRDSFYDPYQKRL